MYTLREVADPSIGLTIPESILMRADEVIPVIPPRALILFARGLAGLIAGALGSRFPRVADSARKVVCVGSVLAAGILLAPVVLGAESRLSARVAILDTTNTTRAIPGTTSFVQELQRLGYVE